MSAAIEALVRALDNETEALASGRTLPDPAAKLALLMAIEGTSTTRERPVLETLAHAARRNRSALATRLDAARGLLDDLHARLADAAADGTYTRAEALGLPQREAVPMIGRST